MLTFKGLFGGPTDVLDFFVVKAVPVRVPVAAEPVREGENGFGVPGTEAFAREEERVFLNGSLELPARLPALEVTPLRSCLLGEADKGFGDSPVAPSGFCC